MGSLLSFEYIPPRVYRLLCSHFSVFSCANQWDPHFVCFSLFSFEGFLFKILSVLCYYVRYLHVSKQIHKIRSIQRPVFIPDNSISFLHFPIGLLNFILCFIP